ncbi:MAG: glycosyltransferase [Pseudomonadota bacterium]
MILAWRAGVILVGVTVRLIGHRLNPPEEPSPPCLYSILIPLYCEAALIPQIVAAMTALNWPANKLDIQLLIEADDCDTLNAARAIHLPSYINITSIPAGGPRTKPNALNYGLARARGAYVTVYDAEDLPDPDQLRTVHAAFQTASETTGCVQAPLIADNAEQTWLTAHWALEYRVQFGLMLRGLSALRLPVLLGGTSNHFRTSDLVRLGGWDAWNVTEDADLGIRLARAGLTCAYCPAPTTEDAPRRLSVWIAQRSRWIKGFLQTWLVLMRRPKQAYLELGPIGFVSAQLSLIAAILAPLAFAPCLILVGLVSIIDPWQIGLVGKALIVFSLSVSLIGDLTAPGRWSLMRVTAMVTRPLYWPLHTLAAIRAVWELAKRPFFWAKTPHRPRQEKTYTSPCPTCSIGSSASASPPD